jgi:capsular polysaccharide biosynthesis protein
MHTVKRRMESLAPKRLSMRGLVRRGWVIPLVMVAVAAIAFGVNRIRSHEVTAKSVVLVTSEAGPDGPGFATEAAKLALSYAAAIPQDQAIVQRVATSIGRSDQYVRDHLGASNPTDTAILELRFRDKNPSAAAAASRAAAEAVTGNRPATQAIGAGSIQIVRLADRPKRPSNGDALAIGIGLALGFGLGVVLVLAWERADPRIDDANDVLVRTGLPATTLEPLTPQAVRGLIEHWSRLSKEQPAHVVIVPVTGKLAGVAGDLADRLQTFAVPRPKRFDGSRFAPPPYENGAPEMVATGPLGSDGSAEAEAARSGVRVLLASRGVRERRLDSASAQLHQFGAAADWLLLVRSRKRVEAWLARNPAPDGQTREEPAAAPSG